MDNSIQISELDEVAANELKNEDLMLISHQTAIADSYVSKSLSIKNLKTAISASIEQFEPDNDSIGFNADNQLEVKKVYYPRVTDLGELAIMDVVDLKLSSFAHMNIWTGTETSYQNLGTKDINTLYFCTAE